MLAVALGLCGVLLPLARGISEKDVAKLSETRFFGYLKHVGTGGYLANAGEAMTVAGSKMLVEGVFTTAGGNPHYMYMLREGNREGWTMTVTGGDSVRVVQTATDTAPQHFQPMLRMEHAPSSAAFMLLRGHRCLTAREHGGPVTVRSCTKGEADENQLFQWIPVEVEKGAPSHKYSAYDNDPMLMWTDPHCISRKEAQRLARSFVGANLDEIGRHDKGITVHKRGFDAIIA